MPPVLIYYVAASLDGYIARPDGSVDWLQGYDGSGDDHGYDAFYASIDGLLMGRATYLQCLGFGAWPYPGKPTVVMTRSNHLPQAAPPGRVAALPAERSAGNPAGKGLQTHLASRRR